MAIKRMEPSVIHYYSIINGVRCAEATSVFSFRMAADK
ncbi:MAG: hypothetical protein V7641_581 [Blastocatellia bacterium]